MENRWIRPIEVFFSSDEEVKAARQENTRRCEEVARLNAAAEAEAAWLRAAGEAEAARLKAEAAKRALAEAKAAKKARLAMDRERAAELKRYYEGVAARDADKKRLAELQSVQAEQARRAFAHRLFHLHGKPVRCLLCGLEMPKWRPVWSHDDPICPKCSGIGTRHTEGVYNGNLRDPFHEYDDPSGGDSGWDLAVRRCEG